jgi:hypothetical protein
MYVEVRGVVELRRVCRGFRHDLCRPGAMCPGHVWQFPQYFSASIEDVTLADATEVARALLLQRYPSYDSAEWKEVHVLDITDPIERCIHCALAPCTHDARICFTTSRLALCRHCVLLMACTFSLDRAMIGLVHSSGKVFTDQEVYKWCETVAAPLHVRRGLEVERVWEMDLLKK